jgi:hypothetical protein
MLRFEVFLYFGLVEHGLFHAMAKRTFIHFEKQENALFSFLACDLELLAQVAQRLLEEELVWIARGRSLEQGRHGPEKNCECEKLSCHH